MDVQFEIRKTNYGKYHFSLIAPNGKTILTSVLFETKDKAEKRLQYVKMHATIDDNYKRKCNGKNYGHFIFTSGDGHRICQSDAYSSAANMEKAIEYVKANAPSARVKDFTI